MPRAVPESFRAQLKEQGYSERMIRELWKWYDKGTNSLDIQPKASRKTVEAAYALIPEQE